MKIAGFYRKMAHAKEGAALFDRLPRRKGMEPARLTALGILLDQSGRQEEALRDLRAALEEEPAFTDALRELYRILSMRGASEELITILENARRARPEGVVASNLLALTYERAGRKAEAASLLVEILKSSPRDVATLTNLAGMRARGGDPTSALALLQRAHEVDPSNPKVLTDLVLALGSMKDLAGAREVFSSAGSAAERAELLNAMAYACVANGLPEEAKGLIHRSLEREPGQPEALRLLRRIESATPSDGRPSSGQPPGL
jgi:Flp pilus assembly protein TadD